MVHHQSLLSSSCPRASFLWSCRLGFNFDFRLSFVFGFGLTIHIYTSLISIDENPLTKIINTHTPNPINEPPHVLYSSSIFSTPIFYHSIPIQFPPSYIKLFLYFYFFFIIHNVLLLCNIFSHTNTLSLQTYLCTYKPTLQSTKPPHFHFPTILLAQSNVYQRSLAKAQHTNIHYYNVILWM